MLDVVPAKLSPHLLAGGRLIGFPHLSPRTLGMNSFHSWSRRVRLNRETLPDG